jgi:hypothetical protein
MTHPEGRSRDGTRVRTPLSNPSSFSGSTVGLSLPAPADEPVRDLRPVPATCTCEGLMETKFADRTNPEHATFKSSQGLQGFPRRPFYLLHPPC